MTPTEKASRLQALIEDSVFKEAVENVRAGIREAWAREKNAVERDMLWHRQAALEDLLNGLRGMQDDIKFESVRFAKIVSRT